MKQDELGRVLRQMVPSVDEAGVWDSITQRAGWRQTNAGSPLPASGERHIAATAKPARPRGIPRTGRLIGIAAAAVVVLLAVGFGINALVDHLAQRDRVIVVTDDIMSPAVTGAAAGSAEQRAKYGQTLSFGDLELTVTVSPTVPLPEEDAPESGTKTWGGKRLRSQIIVQNVGAEAQLFAAADVVLQFSDGARGVQASSSSDSVLIEPGVMLTQRLDWTVAGDATVVAVVYAPEEPAAAVMVWGPDTLVEGEGYPVLQSLPALRPEDVTSIEVKIDDPQGGPSSVEVHRADEPGVDLERLSGLYAQTALVPTEGYPIYRHPVQVTLHLTDGSALAIGLSAAVGDECTIQYTRGDSAGTPPSAVGRNAALVYSFYAEGTGDAGMSMSNEDVLQGRKLNWGETAVLKDRTVTVREPVKDPDAGVSDAGWETYYSMITITNTGSDTFDYGAAEFMLEGNSSASSGFGALVFAGDSNPTVGGEPLLKDGALAPGGSITAAVCFELSEGDTPVKVRLGTRWRNQEVSSDPMLAYWQ